MKKLILFFCVITAMVSCNSEEFTENDKSQSARAFYRKVNVDFEAVNSLKQSAYIYWSINSIDFVGEGQKSTISGNGTGVVFSGSAQTTYPGNLSYTYRAVNDNYLEVVSDVVDRIDINFDYLHQSAVVDYGFRITVQMREPGGSVLAETVETTTAIHQLQTVSLDVANVTDRSDYYIYVKVDAIEGNYEYFTKYITSEMWAGSELNVTSTMSWSLESIRFIDAEGEQVAIITSDMIETKGGTHTLSAYSGIPQPLAVYDGNLLFTKETYTKVEFLFNKIINETYPQCTMELYTYIGPTGGGHNYYTFWTDGFTNKKIFSVDVSHLNTISDHINMAFSLHSYFEMP